MVKQGIQTNYTSLKQNTTPSISNWTTVIPYNLTPKCRLFMKTVRIRNIHIHTFLFVDQFYIQFQGTEIHQQDSFKNISCRLQQNEL